MIHHHRDTCVLTVLRNIIHWLVTAVVADSFKPLATKISSSICSMTSSTSLRLSMKELTLTRNIRFVVAL